MYIAEGKPSTFPNDKQASFEGSFGARIFAPPVIVAKPKGSPLKRKNEQAWKEHLWTFDHCETEEKGTFDLYRTSWERV